MSFTAEDVKALRETTGAGLMDCKKALTETKGDPAKAATWLREKGIASAAKRADRKAKEGAVTSYIHMGGKIGVLAEINCETDFVARSDPFQQFCREVCLQICSVAPRWVRREEVPQSVIDAEKNIYIAQMQDSGKPANMLEKIAEGKLRKFYEENCLLEQQFVKNPEVTIDQLMKELSGKIGEKIDIRRFSRFQLGEGMSGAEDNGTE